MDSQLQTGDKCLSLGCNFMLESPYSHAKFYKTEMFILHVTDKTCKAMPSSQSSFKMLAFFS